MSDGTKKRDVSLEVVVVLLASVLKLRKKEQKEGREQIGRRRPQQQQEGKKDFNRVQMAGPPWARSKISLTKSSITRND